MSLNDNTENQLENGETQEVNENIVSSEIENNTEDNQNDSEIIPADETNAELDDTEESNADIDEDNSKAKKHKNRTLVVATSIFAVTALSFGAWYTFFNNDVSGVWATDVEFTDNSGNTKTAVMKFTQADNSYALDPDDDFKLNNGVVGEWNADGNIVYTFTKDGRFSEDTGNSKTEGTYNFGESDDGYDAIIVKYMYNGEVNTITIPYLLKGDTMTLTFNGYDVDLTKVVK